MAEQDEQPAVDAGDVGEVGEQERHGGRSRAHDVVDAGVVAARDEASGNSQISTVRALADATEPAFAVGARVRSLVEHMKGMNGSVGVVAEALIGESKQLVLVAEQVNRNLFDEYLAFIIQIAEACRWRH